ncbi:MAG: GH3 auxin-responsive promoter family protein [Candidatus Omnitrophica bacterium]|nr:GH3 auxin-responsive promoter family protein [Candidatus Omnitrophota bacterium]
MSFVINSLIRSYGLPASFHFDQTAKSCRKTQSNLLLKLLRKNAACAFGTTHGFASIKSAQEYRNQVPIREFEEFRPYINHILSGKKSVLTVADPVRFNVTSGTTGEPKYIPVTLENQNQEINLIGQWYYRALRDHPKFLDHFRIAIISPPVEGKTEHGVPFGSASGMIFHRIPQFIRRFYAIPTGVSEIKDYEARYFLIARFALAKKVSFLLTPNPSTFIRLAEVIAKEAEAIIRSIHDGKAGKNIEHSALSERLVPDPDRARFLQNVLEKTSALQPRDVWPELKLLACWLGGSVGIQARKLSGYYGNLPIRDIGYMASEAHATLPYKDNTPSGILAIQTNYYEFIPEENHGIQNPPVLSCHELERGKRYAILLTTTSGLYRYDINDIVEVTDFYHQTPVLAFVRKGRDMTNITGEKMHANHFLAAMDEARRQFDLSIEQFRAVPDFENGRYCIYVELNAGVSDEALRDQVIPFMDQALAKVNIEYAEKRKSRRLKLPYLALMRKGWFDDECRRSMEMGKRDIQFKWRILCSEASPEDCAAITKTIENRKD